LNSSKAGKYFIRQYYTQDQKRENQELPQRMHARRKSRERRWRLLVRVVSYLFEGPKYSRASHNRKCSRPEKTYQVKLGYDGQDAPYRPQVPAN
jgi:hypothetical protein